VFVKELWRYPAKSMAGERVKETAVTLEGFPDDRRVLVVGKANHRVITSRTHPRLLGLKGSIPEDGVPRISGHPWNSPEARALVEEASGQKVDLIYHTGVERFDILPLLVATDGAIEYMGVDGRRFRPNIVIGGVEGLAEREWPGRRLRVGTAVIEPAQLRGRCVMTTYDPDTLAQDLSVLKRIARELDGTLALDTSVIEPGTIREGDPVELIPRL
jgi:uncharacterized protein YcbX